MRDLAIYGLLLIAVAAIGVWAGSRFSEQNLRLLGEKLIFEASIEGDTPQDYP